MDASVQRQIGFLSGLSEEEFFGKFLLTNKPCLFDAQMTREWRSRREWVTEGKPDVKYLKTMFEDAVVPVADCGKTEFGCHPKQDMLLSEYMTYWQRVMNISETSSTCDCQPERILYLKDWHFTKAYPDYGAYDLPSHFSVDWLNEFWSKRPDKRDDYRFVYMGPKGTWTPFHADVYRSYSWSANICGSKRWLLVPPYGEENFKDSYGNTLVDIRNVKGNSKTTSPIEVIQNAGEVIFIPSGWYHQVENLDDTISINHNWANACNVDIMFEKLRSDLDEVQCAIGDCTEMDGWHEQCQAILLANSGVNYMEFIQYISTIADRVLRELECLRSSNTAEHKTEFLPSLLDVLSALVLFDFSAKRSLKLEEEIITTSGSVDCTLRFFLCRAFEAKRLGVVLQRISADSVFPRILERSEQLSVEKLTSRIQQALASCCRYTGLPSKWFQLGTLT